MSGNKERMTIFKQGKAVEPDTESSDTLLLDFQPSEVSAIHFHCISHSVYAIFINPNSLQK
jgi:hypothetical protein